MDLALREDRIFSVHEFIRKHSQRVSIKGVCFALWVFLEGGVVKVRDFSLLPQLITELAVHRDWFSDFRYAIFNVNVLDVKHTQALNAGILNEFERLKERVEKELDLIFFEGNGVGLELVDIIEQRSIVAVLGYDVSFCLLLIAFNHFGEGGFGFVESQHFFGYLACIEDLYSRKTYLLMHCKVNYLLIVLKVILVLFKANPVASSLL